MAFRSPSEFREWIRREWLGLAVSAVALVATAVRVHDLGRRVFYYDEAWIGYWVLHAGERGVWEYRPIVHGPFFARVDPLVFSVLGVGDASARLVVALVGGLLPLAAWLFRERLRDGEVLALAAVLAGTPLLVYYSRFMRNDVPLAAFVLVAVGFAVRALDTGRARYLYAGAFSLGLAFTTKESVLLYVVTWVGVGALLLDDRLVRATARGEGWRGTLSTALRRLARRGRTWGPHLAGATLVFLAVVVYFYAPRPALWVALGDPSRLPPVVAAATLGSLRKAVDFWVNGSVQQHPYLPYLLDTLWTLGAGAPAVTALAFVGFLADRYGGTNRPLVAFSFLGGVAAVVGYPLANHFPVPWSTVHAVVPLSIPAAVGAGVVYRFGRRRTSVGTLRATLGPTVATLVLVAAVGNAAVVVVGTSFHRPHESPKSDPGSDVVYYAQAPANLSDAVAAIRRAARRPGGGTDVLFVGGRLSMNESATERPPPPDAWHARIPLPWYTAATGAEVESVSAPWVLAVVDPPPVVITTPSYRDRVAARLPDGYVGRYQPLDDVADRAVVVFVRPRST